MSKSLANRNIGSSYKDLLKVDGNSSGLTSSPQVLGDGDGNDSACNISTNHLNVKPTASNQSSTFDVKDIEDTSLFTVNTTNKTVLAGQNNYKVNCGVMDFYSYFPHGSISTGTHYAMTCGTMLTSQLGMLLGTSTDPDTTIDISATTNSWLSPLTYAQIYKNIEIESINLSYQSKDDSGATNPTFDVHVNTYTTDTTGSTGDASSGALIASSTGGVLTSTTSIYKTTSLTVTTSTITATTGKVIVPSLVYTAAGDDDVIAKLQIRYYLQ